MTHAMVTGLVDGQNHRLWEKIHAPAMRLATLSTVRRSGMGPVEMERFHANSQPGTSETMRVWEIRPVLARMVQLGLGLVLADMYAIILTT